MHIARTCLVLLFWLPLNAARVGGDQQARKLQSEAESTVIPGQYIVVFHKKADAAKSVDNVIAVGGRLGDTPSVLFQYSLSVNGVAVKGLSPEAVNELARDPNVLEIVEDKVYKPSAVTTQINVPSWGLDRIDQHSRNLNKTYRYRNTGRGVHVFIFDTGIMTTHKDFDDRATCGFNALEGVEDCEDDDGHGTHVAGTVGGRLSGVAKEVRLVNVKVLGVEGGSTSYIVAGIEFVLSEKKRNPFTPMVVNMSLGGKKDVFLEARTRDLVAAGIFTVVAAGNESKDACNVSPAAAGGGVITVAATDIEDKEASFSNFGECVQIYAPGEDINSASKESDTSFIVFSGTSMAAPHVAGAAALYLQAHPSWTPARVWDAMKGDATCSVGKRKMLFWREHRLLNTRNLI